jgi:hypothetical protein
MTIVQDDESFPCQAMTHTDEVTGHEFLMFERELTAYERQCVRQDVTRAANCNAIWADNSTLCILC